MVIISSYPASPRRITVLVNFQAILLTSSGETSANRDIFFTKDAAKKNFSDLQNFSTRNSPSVFPYLVKLNDNGSYHGLREPIRKLENHYHELKILTPSIVNSYLLLLLIMVVRSNGRWSMLSVLDLKPCYLVLHL